MFSCMSSRLVSISATDSAHTDPGVVDQDVQAAVALPVSGDDLLDLGLVAQVRRDGMHVKALVCESLDGSIQLLRAARGHRDGEAFLREHPRDGEPYAARCSRNDRCAC